MADKTSIPESRACATCGELFNLNPRYSAAQKARALFCSRSCSVKARPSRRMPVVELLGGERFGRLTLVGEGEDQGENRRARFRCDCGNVRDMMPQKVRDGVYVSCGCAAAEMSRARFTKHGGHRTPEYKSWNAMMQRCHNANCTSYPDYGGRGIAVTPGWHGPQGFERFVADMGPRPRGTTLDRIDGERGYEPGNVRWATPKVQQNNRRVSKPITYNGRTMNASEWEVELGMGKNTVDARIRRGWSVERALTEPLRKGGGPRNAK